MRLSKLSLSKKIVFLSLTVTLLGSITSIISTIITKEVVKQFDHLSEINLPNNIAMSEMSSNFKESYIHYLEWKFATTTERKIEMLDEINEHLEKYEKSDKYYQSIPFVEGEQELYDQVSKLFMKYREQLKLSLEGKEVNELDKIREDYDKSLDQLISFQSKEASKWSKMADELSKKGMNFQVFSLIVNILFSLFLSIWFSRKISQSLAFMIEKVKNASLIVENLSGQYKKNATSLAQASTEQAASLQETAASIEEMSSMIAKTSDNAMVSARSSEDSQHGANKGQEVVGQMMNSMSEINQSNNKIIEEIARSNQQMGEIILVIQEIGSKTKVINDIVFQTKLLSFNASVEAARAGEHGKGFAVVAEEVGNLAEMSGKASTEISQMLDSSILRVENIAKETKEKVEMIVNEGKRKVQNGVEVSMECNNILSEIVKNVAKVSDLAKEISVASKEQTQGVHEINKAVGQLEIVTQDNSRLSDESARAADELSNQSINLKNSVQELEAIITGAELKNTPIKNSITTKKTSEPSLSSPPSSSKIVTKPAETILSAVKKVEPIKLVNESKENFKSKIEPSYKKTDEENTVPDRDQGTWTDV